MSEDKSSYKQIFKATSIFGGVQFFNIIISIVRSKFIAVLVGPTGIGIFGILITTVGLISSVTSFGLGVSSIKDIAYAHQNNKKEELLVVSSVLNKLVWYTGGLGMILTLLFSPLLSKIAFDNYDYTWTFILLSISLFFGQLTLGKDAILQGTRQLKWLAYANISSATVSLLVILPLYFFYGENGIAPSIVIMSAITLVITQYFYNKLKFILPTINFKKTWVKGKSMLKLGFFLSLSGIAATTCAFGVRVFIMRFGGLSDVGFYTAGFGIINSYVGIIFAAMATDYYPRLSGVIMDKNKFIDTVNQQGIVAFIILGPILTTFIVFINYAIIILYSKEFLPIQNMMFYAIIGIFFKAASWLLGFIVLAKGDTKLFFWSEISFNTYQSILSCLGFYYFGLTGLGVSFIVGYLVYLIQMLVISKIKYNFYFENKFLKIATIQIIIGILALICVKFISYNLLAYTLGILLLVITSLFSLYHLNKIVGLKEILSKIKKK